MCCCFAGLEYYAVFLTLFVLMLDFLLETENSSKHLNKCYSAGYLKILHISAIGVA